MALRLTSGRFVFVGIVLAGIAVGGWAQRRASAEALAPVGEPLSWIARTGTAVRAPVIATTRTVGEHVTFPSTRRSEIERMRGEVNRLLNIEARARELEAENARLRELLQFRKESRDYLHIPDERLVPASVIGFRPNNWYATISLDRGSVDGIRPGDCVVTLRGLVGQVYQVRRSSCSVLLVTDPRVSLGARIQRTRDAGILSGDGSTLLRLRYLPKEARVQVGDTVLTSGQGKVYPKGVVVGVVTQTAVDRYTGAVSAIVKPLVEPAKLEQVWVVQRGPGADPLRGMLPDERPPAP